MWCARCWVRFEWVGGGGGHSDNISHSLVAGWREFRPSLVMCGCWVWGGGRGIQAFPGTPRLIDSCYGNAPHPAFDTTAQPSTEPLWQSTQCASREPERGALCSDSAGKQCAACPTHGRWPMLQRGGCSGIRQIVLLLLRTSAGRATADTSGQYEHGRRRWWQFWEAVTGNTVHSISTPSLWKDTCPWSLTSVMCILVILMPTGDGH